MARTVRKSAETRRWYGIDFTPEVINSTLRDAMSDIISQWHMDIT
ncbi:MAG: hypothetical protein RL536_439, partial [Candidatus Parcubacteria bacterium]